MQLQTNSPGAPPSSSATPPSFSGDPLVSADLPGLLASRVEPDQPERSSGPGAVPWDDLWGRDVVGGGSCPGPRKLAGKAGPVGLCPGFWDEVRAGSRGLFCGHTLPGTPGSCTSHGLATQGAPPAPPSTGKSSKTASEASLAGTSPRPASILALMTAFVQVDVLSGDERAPAKA